MATYVARVIAGEFTCNARSEDEAEAKYDAWFEGEDCGCDEQALMCICDYDDDVVDHEWEVYEDE